MPRLLGDAGGDGARSCDGGWLRTGDLVTVNADGTYTFVARVKEVIRRRGENLSPLEVEEVLETHPAVLECAVAGVPSELSEEEVKAFVVAAPGERLDFAELHAFAAGAGRVQGAEVLAAGRRAAPDADRAGGQAPAARGSSTGRIRRRFEGDHCLSTRHRSAPRTPTRSRCSAGTWPPS